MQGNCYNLWRFGEVRSITFSGNSMMHTSPAFSLLQTYRFKRCRRWREFISTLDLCSILWVGECHITNFVLLFNYNFFCCMIGYCWIYLQCHFLVCLIVEHFFSDANSLMNNMQQHHSMLQHLNSSLVGCTQNWKHSEDVNENINTSRMFVN